MELTGRMRNRWLSLSLVFLAIAGCSDSANEGSGAVPLTKTVPVPSFNQDSAFYFIRRQVEFGPRVPNTQGHRDTREFLVAKFQSLGAEVQEQNFTATTFDGNTVNLTNIIASYFPEKNKRVLVAAHWDTRPFADKEEDIDRRDEPIDGANDGGSGVGVILEMARAINSASNEPGVGVDFILFDGEDWGERIDGPRSVPPGDLESWFCLGSQYWSRNKHKRNYSAYYGILLDMVGAKNAQFRIEGYSEEYAGKVVKRIWDWGNALGHGMLFVYENEHAIVDDHKFVNEMGRIPMVNIVHFDPAIGYFGDFHHTHKDNLEIIDKEVLRAVGETVLHVIYHE